MPPYTEPGEILVLNMVVGGTLVGLFLLFRGARRDTCTWPRAWRVFAQTPGWLLVPLGVYGIIGLAVMEMQENRVGLGTGTLVAVMTATIKGVWLAYGRPARAR